MHSAPSLGQSIAAHILGKGPLLLKEKCVIKGLNRTNRSDKRRIFWGIE